MSKFYLLSALFLILSSGTVKAEEDILGNNIDSFLDSPAPTSSSAVKKNFLADFLKSRIPASSALNLEKAEKIFCYTVDYAPADYTGYLIDDLAIKGSCGEISEQGKNILQDAVFANNIAYSTTADKCNISPRVMLRFINGADHTDVLLSYPCPSLTFFHGTNITTINAAPAAEIINKIVNAYVSLEEKYLSPALLGQMVANGQVINQNQKEIVRRMTSSKAPIKRWENKPKEDTSSAKSGWNKLKIE